jgi:hypothetical protein
MKHITILSILLLLFMAAGTAKEDRGVLVDNGDNWTTPVPTPGQGYHYVDEASGKTRSVRGVSPCSITVPPGAGPGREIAPRPGGGQPPQPDPVPTPCAGPAPDTPQVPTPPCRAGYTRDGVAIPNQFCDKRR